MGDLSPHYCFNPPYIIILRHYYKEIFFYNFIIVLTKIRIINKKKIVRYVNAASVWNFWNKP